MALPFTSTNHAFITVLCVPPGKLSGEVNFEPSLSSAHTQENGRRRNVPSLDSTRWHVPRGAEYTCESTSPANPLFFGPLLNQNCDDTDLCVVILLCACARKLSVYVPIRAGGFSNGISQYLGMIQVIRRVPFVLCRRHFSYGQRACL